MAAIDRVARALLLTLAAWLATSAPAFAQKTDVVELANGDRITCEIQKLDRGRLSVKTDGIGNIVVEWDDVVRVTSTARWDVELTSGSRLTGTLGGGEPRVMQLMTITGMERLGHSSIVRLTRIGQTFWRRLDGSLAGGFSFTQADVQTQTTFDANVTYRSHRWQVSLTADSLVTTREDADDQSRNDLSLAAQRFVRPRWSALAYASFQQNEELSLNLRSVFGGGLVRTLAQSNRTRFQGQVGAVYTQEDYFGDDDQKVAEAVGGINWEWFTFDGRSTNFDVQLFTFVALRSDARFRLELTTSFKSDIVSNLYWSITAFESVNSDPPEGRKKTDLGISASVGWTF